MKNAPPLTNLNRRAILFAACAFVIIVMGSIFAVASLRSVIKQKDRVAFEYTETLLDVERLSISAEKKVASSRGYLLSPDDEMYEGMLAARGDFLITLNKLKDEVKTPEGRKYLAEIENAEKKHQDVLDGILLKRQKDEDLLLVNQDFKRLLVPRRLELDRTLNEFEKYKHKRLNEMRQKSVEYDDSAMGIIYLMSFVLSLLVPAMVYIIIRLLKQQRMNEHAVNVSRSRFTDLVNHLDHSIVWEAKANPFEFNFVSERSQFLLGVPGSDWIKNKQSFFNLMPAEDIEIVKGMLDKAVAGMKDERCVHRMHTVDGKQIWLQTGVHPTLNHDGTIELYGLSMDITPLKEAQDTLKRTQSQFNAIMENATSIIFIKDLEGKYTFINRDAADNFNIKGPAMIGKTDAEVFSKDIADKVMAIDHQVIKTGKPVEVEEKFEANGQEVYLFSVKFPLFDPTGKIYGLGGFSTDITDKRSKLDDLRHSEERLGLAIKFSGMGIWDWRLKDRYLIWNENSETIFEYPVGTKNHPYSDFENRVHVDDREIVKKSLQEAIDNNTEFRAEFRIVTPKGNKWIISLGKAIYDKDNTPCRMVGIVIDISDRKMFEKKLQASVRAREEVLAIVSHDLRNPLGVMLMSAGMIERKLKDNSNEEWIRGQAEKIKKSGQRMNELIEDLLSLTKIEAGHFSLQKEEQSVKGLLDEVVETARSLASEKHLQVEVDLPAEDKKVEVDHNQILRVFGNIISNGIKFSPPDGVIKIAADYKEEEVIFSVSDTGPGIAEHHINNVFDRFWQAQGTAHKGTGLGLAISKGIVQAHGGNIWVRSTFGEGATFCFALPYQSAS